MVSLVTATDNKTLLAPIQDTKITHVFQMNKFLAPGPKGFGAGFFQNRWHLSKTNFAMR